MIIACTGIIGTMGPTDGTIYQGQRDEILKLMTRPISDRILMKMFQLGGEIVHHQDVGMMRDIEGLSMRIGPPFQKQNYLPLVERRNGKCG